MNILDKFQEVFNTFKTSGSAESNLFAYWNNFLSNMAPVARDLTRSFGDADWYLHLLSVSRAIDLCFSFVCINYKCCLPAVLFQWIRLWKKLIANQENYLLVLLASPEDMRPIASGT